MNILSLVCVLLAMVSNAQLQQGPLYSSGEQAVFYNGGNRTVVSSSKGQIKGDYTIAAWVYPTARARDWARVIGKGSSSQRNYGLWIHPSGWVLSQTYCLTAGHNAYLMTKYVPLNQWSLVVGVFKKDQYHRVYVDGELLAEVKPRGNSCIDNQPITVGKADFHTGFIGKIKKAQLYNYAMNDAQLDALEEDVPLTHIVDWLHRLITEANQEIKSIEAGVKGNEATVKRLQEVFDDASKDKELAEELLSGAIKVKNTAFGKKTAVCAEAANLVPGLNSEIDTFTKVISKLRGLLLDTDLVEDSINVTAFISLEDQADPAKVNKVVTLVEDLIAKARSQIAALEKACKDAEDQFAIAEGVVASRTGDLKAAVKALETADQNLLNALAALKAARANAAQRIPQLESEIKSLEEAINLIQSVQ